MPIKLSKNDFIRKAEQIHNNKYDYSKVEYINNKAKVCIICPEHGEFWQRPDRHLMGQGCPVCRYVKSSKSNASNTQHFIEKAKQVHGNKYDYSKVEYVNNSTKVCIICPKHCEFWQTPRDHLQGKGCPKCANKNISTEEFIEKAKKVHGDKYNYKNVIYNGSRKYVYIVCPIHGIFKQTPHEHLNGHGCLLCNSNKLENEVSSLLKENGIIFEKEKTFPWLKDKNKLRIDFYLPDYNVAIECQGIQHFEPVEYFGGDLSYEEQKAKDLYKIEKLSEKKVTLLYYSHYFQVLSLPSLKNVMLSITILVLSSSKSNQILIRPLWNVIRPGMTDESVLVP